MKAVHVRYALYGLVFGFILSRIGFSDFGEVHKMFTFADLRLFLTFCTGVGLSFVGFMTLTRMSEIPRRAFNPGNIMGGVLFGAGWALTGACPSILLVQLGEGQLAGLATLAGALAGMVVYPSIHRRFFRWPLGSCAA
ncbi:MAG: YeeE/YedE family protein [Myxococcales bacterium]|nr:YeeE/YedE family protein [Myxococcales bacterium]